jgi:hypothetical protein
LLLLLLLLQVEDGTQHNAHKPDSQVEGLTDGVCCQAPRGAIFWVPRETESGMCRCTFLVASGWKRYMHADTQIREGENALKRVMERAAEKSDTRR